MIMTRINFFKKFLPGDVELSGTINLSINGLEAQHTFLLYYEQNGVRGVSSIEWPS